MSELVRQLWAPALAVLLVHLAITGGRRWLREDDTAAPVRRGAMMVAAGGPLEELAIQFHRPGAELFLAVYRQLFSALDPETTVHVVVGDETDREIFEEARRGWAMEDGSGPRVRYAVVGRPITSWARDRLAVLDPVDEGPITIFAPPAPMTGPETRGNDWLVPWSLRSHLGDGAELVRATFRFEGGDLIADEDNVYVATPLFGRNPTRTPASLLRTLEEALSRPVIRLGTDAHPAPSHHVGMFVTPLGNGVVAFGDPELGLALMGDGDTLEVGGAPLAIERDPEALRPFLEVGRTLAAKGLDAFSLPLIVSREAHTWISYGNVLMERRRDGRLHVYMPVYGLPPLDARARAIYEARGAVVHPIHVARLFRLGGTVRCLVAPLRRGPIA